MENIIGDMHIRTKRHRVKGFALPFSQSKFAELVFSIVNATGT